jgi:outer membrane protein TolC
MRRILHLTAALCLAAAPAIAAPRTMSLTLPEAVFLALRNNRGIHSQYLQRIVDKFALRVAEDAYTPKLTLGGSVLQGRSAGTSGSSLAVSPAGTLTTVTGAAFTFGWANNQARSQGSRPSGGSNAQISFSQPLLAGGGLDVGTAPLRQARLAEQNAQLALRNNISSAITGVIIAYRQLILTEQQARIAEAALKRARDLRDVNRLLIEAGRLARVELVQSEQAIAQAELALSSARNSNNSARLALLTLLALELEIEVRPTEKLLAPPVAIDTKQAVALAFANQPAYLQQALQQDIARINLMLAKNQRLWSVALVGGTGLQNRGVNIPDSVGGLAARRADYQIGLQFSVPINDLSRQQAEVNATIGLRQVELAREQAAATLEQQVTDAVASLTAQTGELEQTRRARTLSVGKLEIELARLQAGRSSNFQVVSFQNDVQQAENAELSATVAYLNALTVLDQLLGTTLETWKIELNDR